MHIDPFLWSVIVLCGLVVGSYSSVVGGGAFFWVPVLSLFGLPLVAAIATVRVSATLPQVVTVAAFSRHKELDWRSALFTALFAVPGGYLGARMTVELNQTLVAYVIAGVLLAFLPLVMRFNGKQSLRAHHRMRRGFYPLAAAVGFLLGLYGGFYGAAFSTLLMVFFAYVGGFNLLVSSGSSSVVTALLSAVASYPFIRAGLVNWDLAIPITIGQSIGSWYGVRIAERQGAGWIKWMMVAVIIAAVVKILAFPS